MKYFDLSSKNRPSPHWTKLALAGVLAAALAGCGGSDGTNGTNGTNGANGTNGTNGTNAVATTNVAALTPTLWADAKLTGTVTGVTIASPPVVSFKVTDAVGNPVVGLGATSKNATATLAGYTNLAFSIAKLVPGTNGSPSKWVSYIVTTAPTYKSATDKTIVPAAPTRPSTDNTGTLVDNGDGSYKYTFYRDITKIKADVAAMTVTAPNVLADLGDLTYDPSLTHRVTVAISGNALGTGSNTADGVTLVTGVAMKNPVNAIYDFIPATGKPVAATDAQREIVKMSACLECHSKFAVHGGGRQDPRYCVVCHTDQRKYGRTEAVTTATGYSGSIYVIGGRSVFDLPTFIHKIHMGEELMKTGYNAGGVLFNEVTYPQDQRNCVKCHDGSATAVNKTAQGDNWKNVPNIAACGACHDGINFATGGGMALNGSYAGHVGGAKADDKLCATCHDAVSIATVNHVAVLPPNSNSIYANPTTGNNNTNASSIASVKSNLPAGASQVTWDLKSVTLNASAQPVFTFRFLKDGAPVVFNTYSATGKTELMDNFVGGPSAYLAFAVPQDGITSPSDWNATVSTYVKNVWRGTGKNDDGTSMSATAAGTLAFDATSGYYTLTLTGVKIPTTAKMMIGGIGYTYALLTTQPLTQTNVTGYAYNSTTKIGGLSVPAPNVTKLVSGTLPTGFTAATARRAIVENARCNSCHQALGVFTAKTFHAGQRNDAATCTFCHNVNRVNSGWGVNIKEAVHSIHAAGKRVNKFSWEASAGDMYWKVGYPGVLNNCEQCHVPGSYDFSNATNAAAVPNLLWTTVATGTVPSPVNVVVTGTETIPGTYWSPFVTAGAAYGSGFATNFGLTSTTPYTDAAATTLVSSPITSACASCHDTPTAIAHMKGNAGHFYDSRTVVGNVTANPEACLICHGTGKVADIKAVHMN